MKSITIALFTKHVPTRDAEKYYTMKKLTSKLQRTAANIMVIFEKLFVFM